MTSDEDLMAVIQDALDELAMRGYQATSILTKNGKTVEISGDSLTVRLFHPQGLTHPGTTH